MDSKPWRLTLLSRSMRLFFAMTALIVSSNWILKPPRSGWRNLEMIVSSGRYVIPRLRQAKSRYIQTSHSAYSIAGFEKLNHSCKKWIYNITSPPNRPRLSFRAPHLVQRGTVIAFNGSNWTTSFISFRETMLASALGHKLKSGGGQFNWFNKSVMPLNPQALP